MHFVVARKRLHFTRIYIAWKSNVWVRSECFLSYLCSCWYWC